MSTLILSIILFLIGTMIKNKIYFFNKFCIPAPVISGVLFSVVILILRLFKICSVTMDTRLMPYFICAFFTIVGLGVSVDLIKKGGKLLIKYWLLCGVLAYCQNLLALGLSRILNFHPLLALMCGTISMEGGHGTAAAFGATIENLGVNDAISVGITAATFGLIISGLLGGPIAKFLISRHNLKPNKITSKCNTNDLNSNKNTMNYKFSTDSFLEQILIVLLCISLGEIVAKLFSNYTNIIIPAISGCMVVSTFFRNINDRVKFFKFDFYVLDFLGDACLGIFLTMALMSIDLYKLSSLFGPILIIVLCQAIFITFYSIFICFNILGKDLNSAIMISGLIGHGLGATPTALANMNSVSNIYGHSEKAILVVTIVAAFLLDVFTMPCIIFFINILS